MPFSTGPRACIGQNFATLEALSISAAILRQVEFLVCSGEEKFCFGIHLNLAEQDVRKHTVDQEQYAPLLTQTLSLDTKNGVLLVPRPVL